MEPSSDTKWCKPRDHMVTQPTRKDTNSRKAMFGYAFIYTNSKLKETIMNPP
jgi:hypothetical protein